jgi:hypothetical protein
MIDGGERFTTEDTENAEEGERQKLKGKKFLSLTLPFTLSYSSFFSESLCVLCGESVSPASVP